MKKLITLFTALIVVVGCNQGGQPAYSGWAIAKTNSTLLKDGFVLWHTVIVTNCDSAKTTYTLYSDNPIKKGDSVYIDQGMPTAVISHAH